MSDQDQEANRAKQLEEARKRVEEIKKRSKKNKKKGKKSAEKNQDVQPTESVEGSETGGQEEGSELEESRGSVELELQTKDSQIPKGESIDAEESHVEPPEESLEPKISKKESSNEQGTQTPETRVEAEDQQEKADHGAQTSGELQETLTDRVQTLEEEKPEASQKGTEELFGGESSQESDFLATIQKEREQTEIEDLRNQLEKVSLENKKLKFVNMDQETEIEELQNEISQLKQRLEENEQQLAALQSQEKEKNSRTSSQYPQQIDFASFSNPNASPQPRSDETNINQVTVNRAALNKWRNWNIDMTTWRSIGSGPIVEF